jgi:hypothetical protein
MRGLIYSTRGVSGIFHATLIYQMKIVESRSSVIDFMTPTKTDKSKLHIEKEANIRIANQTDNLLEYYHTRAKNLPSWNAIYEDMNVDFLREYDDLYLFGSMLSTASGFRRDGKRFDIFPMDAGQIKFESIGIQCIHILALLKAHKEFGIRLHEITHDAMEMPYDRFHPDYRPNPKSYWLYHQYDIPYWNMQRIDSLQYYLQHKKRSLFEEPVEKTIDFCFAYTVIEKSRAAFITDIECMDCQFDKTELYVFDKITGVDTSIPKDQYLKRIAAARYTMIVPSYDEKVFSFTRFIEAIHNDCLPLIQRDVNVDDVSASFGVNMNLLKSETPFDESRRLELLDYYKTMLKYEKGLSE